MQVQPGAEAGDADALVVAVGPVRVLRARGVGLEPVVLEPQPRGNGEPHGSRKVIGDASFGKSSAMRLLETRLSALVDLRVGVLSRPQSGVADFYRERTRRSLRRGPVSAQPLGRPRSCSAGGWPTIEARYFTAQVGRHGLAG